MKVFSSALIIIVAIILYFIPITQAVYDFRSDQRTDTFTLTTASATSANVTLSAYIFESNTSTVVFSSSIAESLAVVSYNGTTKTMDVGGLTANTTRLLGITYDKAAFTSNAAIDILLGYTPLIWYLVVTAILVAASIAAILAAIHH